MTDFTKGQGQGTGAGLEPKKTSGSGTGYKSKLDEILAKAGGNNPIAAAQARNLGKPQQPAPQANYTAPPAPAAPAAPQAPADPNQRLQQILAMAGQTPAQRAQSQAQQSQANNAGKLQAGILQYMQAIQQDPTRILEIVAEFPNLGQDDEYYLRCYANAAGQIFWDLHGDDIDYQLKNTSLSQYAFHDNYYRGIPDQTMQAEFATAKISSCTVV